MALSAIHLLNWFYSISLNRLSLICFCNLKKKKKKLVWKIRVNRLDPTCNPIDPFWPANLIDLTRTWPDPPIFPRLVVWDLKHLPLAVVMLVVQDLKVKGTHIDFSTLILISWYVSPTLSYFWERHLEACGLLLLCVMLFN